MRAWVFFLLGAALLRGDLASVKAEPNLEKRSELAIVNANEAIDVARKAMTDGQEQQFNTSVDEVLASVELAYASLEQTGKEASRKPKYFKRAELGVRSLLRRIKGLEQDASIDDRPKVTAAREKIQDIHEKLLFSIMERKK